MNTIEFQIRGRTPLMMHNVRLANPLCDYTKQLGELNRAKKVKGADKDAVNVTVSRVEWEGGLYHTETEGQKEGIGAYVPAANLHKAIIEAARLTKEGKTVEQGLSQFRDRFRLDYEGPRGIDDMWTARRFCDIRMVKVGQAMVPRARPFFASWSLKFSFYFDPDMLTEDRLRVFVKTAGLYKGIGEARGGVMGMGRFEVQNVDGSWAQE